MPSYSSPGTFVNGSTSVPVSAGNLNPMVNVLLQTLQADGTGPSISADLPVNTGHGLIGNSDPADNIKIGLNGSTDCGTHSDNHTVRNSSGFNSVMNFNAKFDGTNDRFISAAVAYQLFVNTTGVGCRKSTNTPSAGAVITWGTATMLFT